MPRGITPRRPSRSGRHERRQPAAPVRARVFTEKPRARAAKPDRAAPKQRAQAAAASAQRIAEILRRLEARYPGVTCALQHRNAWELVVATILSAQCTDVRVNMVTPELFRRYPSPSALAALTPEELEPQIRSTGFFRNKSKSLVGAAKKIVEEFRGQVPAEMSDLLSLPGVARKTANVVLGTWFRKNEGVVVDTHVYRIARRMELTAQADAGRIEQELIRLMTRGRWRDVPHQDIWFGRTLCVAPQPQCADGQRCESRCAHGKTCAPV